MLILKSQVLTEQLVRLRALNPEISGSRSKLNWPIQDFMSIQWTEAEYTFLMLFHFEVFDATRLHLSLNLRS